MSRSTAAVVMAACLSLLPACVGQREDSPTTTSGSTSVATSLPVETTVPVGFAVSPALRSRLHLERARAHFALGDVPAGLVEYDLAVDLAEEPDVLRRQKGWYLEHVARDRQAAIAAYEAAIARDPGSDWAQSTREYLDGGLSNFGICPVTAKPGDDCS